MSNIKPFVFSSFDEVKTEEIKVEESQQVTEQPPPSVNVEEQIEKLYEERLREGYERGYEEGFAKGYIDGKQEAEKKAQEEVKVKVEELKSQIELFKKVSEELSTFKERQLELLLPQIMRLSFKIAEKVVATKINLDREVTVEILREALKEVPLDEENIIIKLNPEDLSMIADKLGELGLEGKKIKLEPISSIHRGDVEIETESLHIVSTLEKKLEEIENAINSLLSKQS